MVAVSAFVRNGSEVAQVPSKCLVLQQMVPVSQGAVVLFREQRSLIIPIKGEEEVEILSSSS